MAMARTKIKFWGVRGSMASPGRGTIWCGGNTSCLEIEAEDTRIICDAGTGIRPLGIDLIRRMENRPTSAHIILSHIHWDHYIGLPFFKPLYDAKNKFVIAGPKPERSEFGPALTRVINQPYFPMSFSRIPSRIDLKTILPGRMHIGRVSVDAMEMNHPGGSLGWRFYFPNGRSVVHVTDNEPVTGAALKKLVRWMRGADILIHDAQFNPKNYAEHEGWGHSPFTYPLMLADLAHIKRLFLFHFDPGDDDAHMRKILAEARRMIRASKQRIQCDLAREGVSIMI